MNTLATKYLSPKYDIAFKKIFGTEKNKNLLLNFLNEVLKKQISLPIEEVTFLKTVQDPDIASQKESVVDVLCKDKKGVQYIIEMQVAKTAGFEARAQYYAARAYGSQMLAGENDYRTLKEVIFIALADYDIFPDDEDYKSEHVILNKKTLVNHLDKFSFTFVNLPKFNEEYKKSNRTLKDLSLEEKWYYFVKNAEATTDSELEELVGGDIVIREAYKELDRFNWTEEELATYEGEIKTQLDNEAAKTQIKIDAEAVGMKKGEEKGRVEGIKIGEEKGLEKGIKIGEEKGKVETKIEIAKMMISKGVDIDSISEFTGLSKSELEMLLETL